jgi:predicted DNA-binding transcriptional regulator AlpA
MNPQDDLKPYLTAAQVRQRYGVTDMTLWRWLHDERVKFPHPYYFSRFRYWKLSDLQDFEKSARRLTRRAAAA